MARLGGGRIDGEGKLKEEGGRFISALDAVRQPPRVHFAGKRRRDEKLNAHSSRIRLAIAELLNFDGSALGIGHVFTDSPPSGGPFFSVSGLHRPSCGGLKRRKSGVLDLRPA